MRCALCRAVRVKPLLRRELQCLHHAAVLAKQITRPWQLLMTATSQWPTHLQQLLLLRIHIVAIRCDGHALVAAATRRADCSAAATTSHAARPCRSIIAHQ